jgi:nicotinamide phosphoribosyltransferase
MSFGSGGALLQKVNRDTFKWAQKASSILIKGNWMGIAKDPVSDAGKKSQEGVLTAIRNDNTGEMKNFDLSHGRIPLGWSDAHILLYHNGVTYNEQDAVTVRARLGW